jgi:hypothetical protein
MILLYINISLNNNTNDICYITLTDWILESHIISKMIMHVNDYYLFNRIMFFEKNSNSWGTSLSGSIDKNWTYFPTLVELGFDNILNLQIIIPVKDIVDSLKTGNFEVYLDLSYTDFSTFFALKEILNKKGIDYNNIVYVERDSTFKVILDRKKLCSATFMKKEKHLKKEISNYLKLTFRNRLLIRLPIEKSD